MLYTYGAGSVVTVAFDGTGIDWIAIRVAHERHRERERGRRSTRAGRPLLRRRTIYQKIVWGVSGLANGRHTLTFTTTGTKNAASSSTIVNFDAFDIAGTLVPITRYEQNTPGIAYSGPPLTTTNSALYSGGSVLYTYGAGSVATVAFDGTGIDWIAIRVAHERHRERERGRRGTRAGRPLLRDGTTYQKKVWGVSGLANGRHTSSRSPRRAPRTPSSSSTIVNFDAFDITGTLVPITRYEQNDPGIALHRSAAHDVQQRALLRRLGALHLRRGQRRDGHLRRHRHRLDRDACRTRAASRT